MNDIAMCQNHECPKRIECYRYCAKPNEFQYYSQFDHKDGKCDYFYPIFRTTFGGTYVDPDVAHWRFKDDGTPYIYICNKEDDKENNESCRN